MVMSHSAPHTAVRPTSADPNSIRSLLDQLETEYPELSERVAMALGRAYATEETLAAGTEVKLARVAMLARDRLDVIRRHEHLPEHQSRRGYQLPADGPHASGDGRAQVPCTYCLHPMPPESFIYWSARGLLLSATCPDCHRQSTLRASTWERLSDLTSPTGQPTTTSGR
jgi:hypothetical protein